ncbi:MAG: alpha/beta fold hydrolase [Pseudomonadota bacterium]
MDHEVFDLGDFPLHSGAVMKGAFLAFRTYGTLNAAGDNAVVMPTFYTGTHTRNEIFFGAGRPVDPARHFIIGINMFGNGLSASPSNLGGADFPQPSLADNVAAQHRLVTALGVKRIALVYGWSMAGCQTYQWAHDHPEMVAAILPFCASARCAPHNWVFLDGVAAALRADQSFANGRYATPPRAGLEAFGRVYAGWAFSQTYFREALHRPRFETKEDLLAEWAREHAEDWDANDLLCMLHAWQAHDIAAGGELSAALRRITARAIIAPCSSDLYFRPEDNAAELPHLPNAELRVFETDYGHCAVTGNDPAFPAFLDACLRDLLA